MTPERPWLPKLSLYSDQPISPSSVMTLRNENIRQPASQRSVSIRVTFMTSSKWIWDHIGCRQSRMMANALFRADPRGLDGLRIAFALRLQQRCELLGRARHRALSLRTELVLDLGRLEDAHELSVEPRHRRCRSRSGHDEAAPVHRLELREAHLAHCRHVRQQLRARRAGDYDC